MKKDEISTIFNSEEKFTSDSEKFYKNYWTNSNFVKPEKFAQNQAVLDKFFIEGIKGKKVLEIGVGGEGGIIINLCSNNQVFGIDVSESAIENCKRMGLNVSLLNIDKTHLPFPDKEFDIIFAFEVFEHFSNPQFALEEIRRTLKPEGKLLISIPSTYTYHWPRLFYPNLFEKDNFMDFLLVNEFEPVFVNDWRLRNAYFDFNIPEEKKSWSWYFISSKLDINDPVRLFEAGKHFWGQKDSLGLRLKPIEALGFFERAFKLDPSDYIIKLYYTYALLYRVLYEDPKAIETFVRNIREIIQFPTFENKAIELESLRHIFEMHLDLQRFRQNIFTNDFINSIIQKILIIDNDRSYFDELFNKQVK